MFPSTWLEFFCYAQAGAVGRQARESSSCDSLSSLPFLAVTAVSGSRRWVEAAEGNILCLYPHVGLLQELLALGSSHQYSSQPELLGFEDLTSHWDCPGDKGLKILCWGSLQPSLSSAFHSYQISFFCCCRSSCPGCTFSCSAAASAVPCIV